MKYIILLIFLILPSVSYGIQSVELFSQQRIGKTDFQLGFKDLNFYDNSRDYFLDILAEDIFEYIIENIDSETAELISRHLKRSVSDCEEDFEQEFYGGMKMLYATRNLKKCKDAIYSENFQIMMRQLHIAKKGMYKSLLKEMFSKDYYRYMTEESINMDEFVNQLAEENLVSFSGKLFHSSIINVPTDEIICENKHKDLDIINKADNKTFIKFHMHGKPYAVKGCLNVNNKNYFSYASLWKRGSSDDEFDLLARVPFFKYYFLDESKKRVPVNLKSTVKRNRIELIEMINPNFKSSLNYVYRINWNDDVFLHEIYMDFDNKKFGIYKENIEKGKTFNANKLSIDILEVMLNDFCKANYNICINAGLERKLYPNTKLIYTYE